MYKDLLEFPDADLTFHTFSAACLFYMAAYDDAKEAALKGETLTQPQSNSTPTLIPGPKANIMSNYAPSLGILNLSINLKVYFPQYSRSKWS